MGYQSALEAAGCKVLQFKEFGSYQGNWLAFVEYNGEKGIVQGTYGSCSGCDSFQAEFDYFDAPTEDSGKYFRTGHTWDESNECSKEEYEVLIEKENRRLSDFGKTYLTGGLYNKQHFQTRLKQLGTEDWFDLEDKEYCEWAINQNWD